MNSDQVLGALRALVPTIVAYAVGKGWIPAASAADVGAAIIALGAAGWSVYAHTNTNKIAAVAALPDVQKVVTTPTIANQGPLADNQKVVSQ